MKKYILTILILFIFPLFVFASWWNPFTWGNKGEKVEELESYKREVPFRPMAILGTDDIRCSIDESAGIYDKNNSIETEEVVEIQDLKRDKNPIKFTFKLDGKDAKILIGDAGGLSEVNGLVLTDNEDKIHIINSWGIGQDNIQTFSIYPKTGFFTWVRMGDLMLLYNSLGYGYGRCL